MAEAESDVVEDGVANRAPFAFREIRSFEDIRKGLGGIPRMGILAARIPEALAEVVEPGGAFHHLGIRAHLGAQPPGQAHHRLCVLEAVVEGGLGSLGAFMGPAPEAEGIGAAAFAECGLAGLLPRFQPRWNQRILLESLIVKQGRQDDPFQVRLSGI